MKTYYYDYCVYHYLLIILGLCQLLITCNYAQSNLVSIPEQSRQVQEEEWTIGLKSHNRRSIDNTNSNNNADNGQYFKYETCTWFYASNPDNCGSYYQCNFGQALLRDCPPGLFWNNDVTTCDWPNNVRGVGIDCQDPTRQHTQEQGENDKESDTIIIKGEEDEEEYDDVQLVRAEKCIDGDYKSNPSDCNSFFRCNHGVYILQLCPSSLNWNQGLKICDWPYNSDCSTIQTTGSSSTSTSTTIQPEVPIPISATSSTTQKPTITTTQKSTTTTRPTPSSQQYKVICYFTDWSWYRPGLGKFSPSNINPSLCTHIIYTFALLDKSAFVIKPADSWADIDSGHYSQVTAFKASHGIKVLLAIGGWNDSEGDGYSRLVNSPSNRAKFISSVVSFLAKYNFDGLDLDWEYPKCWQGDCSRGPVGDKDGFSALVVELRAALPSGALLSAAVSASKIIIDAGYDVPKLSAALDWIGVMDYDFHGSWDHKTGHIAPLYYNPGDDFPYFNANYSISHWMGAGAPASKLILGIPLYGQTFTLSNPAKQNGLNSPSTGPGTAGPFTRQAGVLSYYEICNSTWTKVVQNPNGTMGPYAYNTGNSQWVSYDDVGFVGVKANYVKSHGLGGAMIWALDFDDFNNICGHGTYPLLSTISNNLLKKS